MKILFFLLFSLSAFAEDSAKVILLKGEATFRGQPLTKDKVIVGQGEFVVGDKSYLKILLLRSKAVIALAANTTSTINLAVEAEQPELNLFKGAARWVSGESKKAGGGIRTKNAVMGIRGTDFIAIANPLFNESEIICFDGRVQFTSIHEPSDLKMVNKNQWGGIGGRFGKRTAPLIDLSPEALDAIKATVPLE